MNCFRLRGSPVGETCSALTVLPRITKRSTPDLVTTSWNSTVRCGLNAPATGTPASRISPRRCSMSCGLIGSEYIFCISAVAISMGSSRIFSITASGLSYRVQSPSRLRTPMPPSLPIVMAVRGETTESIGAASTGISNLSASIDHVVLTASGSRVRRLGTTAMSSNENARRARLARPISISLMLRAYRL